MTKKNVIFVLLFISVPVMFFFQNCSGSASSTLANVTAINSITTSDSLEIIPPNSGNDINLNPPGNSSDNITSDKGSIGPCDQLVVSDILLKIISISTHTENPNEASFEIIDADKSISLENLTLKIRAKKSERVSNLTILLHAQGNKILTADNVVIDVKSSVDEQSVIRINLAQEYSVNAEQTYNLVLTVNPNEIITTNKNTCLFKPLIQTADLNTL